MSPRGRSQTVRDSVAEFVAAITDELPIVESCLFCKWRWVGLVADGRDAARRHREEKHPEAVGRRTVRRLDRRYSVLPPGAELIQEQRRVRELREEAEKLATIERGRLRRELEGMA